MHQVQGCILQSSSMMGFKQSELKHTSLYDRVQKLLISFDWSDCSFSVSRQTFKAHKLILGISSPVFEAMFYGPLSSNDDIIITDIEPDIFQLVLNYIYTDKVTITSIEQAYELLYASKKYLLEHLMELCVTYIQENISIDNVVTILNYPEYLQDPKVTSYSLKLFCEHASYLLRESKHLISPSCMKKILQSDFMNIEENDLIKYVFEWIQCYSEKAFIHDKLSSRQEILFKNGLLELLRFEILNSKEIDAIFSNFNSLLLPDELEKLKVRLSCLRVWETKDNTASSDLVVIPRRSLKMSWTLCLRSPLRSAAPIVIDTLNHTVHSRIKSYKTIFINALCVPTRLAPALNFHCNATNIYSEQFSVSIVSEYDNSIIKYTNFMNNVEYNSIVDLELSEPCLLRKNKWYKVSFTWPQNGYGTYTYTVEHREIIYKDPKFYMEFEDSTGGSFLAGLKICL